MEILIEGEYKNGEKNGKYNEYDKDGNLLFEGEYYNDKIWNGKGFDKNGNITYELMKGKGFIKKYEITISNYKIFSGKYIIDREKEKNIIIMVN